MRFLIKRNVSIRREIIKRGIHMNENRKFTSIALKMNASFLLKRFFGVIWFNIVLCVLIVGTYVYWINEHLPENSVAEGYNFKYNGYYRDITYNVETSNGKEYTYKVFDFFDYLAFPGLCLLSFECLYLLGCVGGTNKIRRKLRPLNELAKKAEEISSVSLDYTKFENLEHAIYNVSPDAPGAKISTDDKDLQSIEIAINNLIYRMKESQKQQTRFVSDASHELRTPIAVIQGYVNMLDRWGKEDEKVLVESIEAIKNESQHMKELIEQLLFLARGDSGRNNLKLEEINLKNLMEEVWEESLMIDEKHVYSFDGEENLIINGDVAMIKQSARIFIQNAAKYSPEGTKITIKAKLVNGAPSYIIQDEGLGMNQEEVSHIFERFYRSDEARNGNTGGTGLGLSIAKWIVDAHNGLINVVSSDELGTRFTISFVKEI